MQDGPERLDAAVALARQAGVLAMRHFADRESLAIDSKGAQDWVSEADRAVETLIRQEIAARWPKDGIVGEEHGTHAGTSGFTWVIDPIDGTTNFVNGIPAWCVVLAGVRDDRIEIGVIHDPLHDETFAARAGGGATLNGKPVTVAREVGLRQGSVAVGYSGRIAPEDILPVLTEVIATGALFHRNASGALSLAYVAAGRLLGYIEEHMNAWDCLAGQLLIAEAGGHVEPQDARAMIATGGRVVAGPAGVFEALQEIADRTGMARVAKGSDPA